MPQSLMNKKYVIVQRMNKKQTILRNLKNHHEGDKATFSLKIRTKETAQKVKSWTKSQNGPKTSSIIKTSFLYQISQMTMKMVKYHQWQQNKQN